MVIETQGTVSSTSLGELPRSQPAASEPHVRVAAPSLHGTPFGPGNGLCPTTQPCESDDFLIFAPIFLNM